MKYDLSKKATKGAQRTLDAFSAAMFQILSGKSFYEITVNELCQQSNYPRATFYNYFDDKYDLLNYCWQCLYKQIHLEEYENLSPEERLSVFFDRAYDFVEANQTRLKQILKSNTEEKVLLLHFRIHLGAKLREIFYLGGCIERYALPYELVADHYCNTILLILEWRFLKENDCPKAQALQYLNLLLGALNMNEKKGV
ncbi:transcriptional regulator [Paenibacillus helianthi]|uniref:Transcriptional regulator n=1 Tax=Paenibacillus helianthi TaxID=1349432 RepID=A0ABX3EIY0_9BACL|nr:TetR/AcrR family transcriptional regulator [Paenibacillus helianthi]OKP83957.1 transcriptional regulator [Paenibacillus helianthi]